MPRLTNPRAVGYEDTTLRPQTLAQYDVGQVQYLRPLRVAIAFARDRGTPLEHVLIDGPPGLGKTTLAEVIANELGRALVTVTGPALKGPKELIGLVGSIQPLQVVFIDEVHRMPVKIAERLYSVLEDSRFDLFTGSGSKREAVPYRIPPCTFIGATTLAGRMPQPLRDRFGMRVHLDFYGHEQLARIVLADAQALSCDLSPEAAQRIARCSRGTPRIAKRLFRRVREYAEVSGRPADDQLAEAALRDLGIDGRGLDALDRAYLTALATTYGGGPAGLQAIAATMQVEADTLEDSVEPYLLRQGLIRRTGRGRELAKKAPEPAPEPKPRIRIATMPVNVVTTPLAGAQA